MTVQLRYDDDKLHPIIKAFACSIMVRVRLLSLSWKLFLGPLNVLSSSCMDEMKMTDNLFDFIDTSDNYHPWIWLYRSSIDLLPFKVILLPNKICIKIIDLKSLQPEIYNTRVKHIDCCDKSLFFWIPHDMSGLFAIVSHLLKYGSLSYWNSFPNSPLRKMGIRHMHVCDVTTHNLFLHDVCPQKGWKTEHHSINKTED